MPILVMALMALLVFVGMGLLLFSATIAETHTREQMEASQHGKARKMHA
jgi:hypothetical protein